MSVVNIGSGLLEVKVVRACKLIQSKVALSLSAIPTSLRSKEEVTIRDIVFINKC